MLRFWVKHTIQSGKITKKRSIIRNQWFFKPAGLPEGQSAV